MAVNHGNDGDVQDAYAANSDCLELRLMEAVSQMGTRMELISKKSIETITVDVDTMGITKKMSLEFQTITKTTEASETTDDADLTVLVERFDNSEFLYALEEVMQTL